jgi:hypothetical protein
MVVRLWLFQVGNDGAATVSEGQRGIANRELTRHVSNVGYSPRIGTSLASSLDPRKCGESPSAFPPTLNTLLQRHWRSFVAGGTLLRAAATFIVAKLAQIDANKSAVYGIPVAVQIPSCPLSMSWFAHGHHGKEVLWLQPTAGQRSADPGTAPQGPCK